jgi:hypothetical protein
MMTCLAEIGIIDLCLARQVDGDLLDNINLFLRGANEVVPKNRESLDENRIWVALHSVKPGSGNQ